MLIFNNKCDTAIIVLHEIYGINRHMAEVCQKYSSAGYDVICPDLLNLGKPFEYSQQEEAYSHFMNHIGFDLYNDQVNQLLNQIRASYKKIILIGLSVGATIAWRCTESGLCDGIIGYYGSRIRDYLDISPVCPTLLIFARKEKSFSADQVMGVLQKKKNTSATILEGEHGFYDPYSYCYNFESAKEADELTYEFLQNQ